MMDWFQATVCPSGTGKLERTSRDAPTHADLLRDLGLLRCSLGNRQCFNIVLPSRAAPLRRHRQSDRRGSTRQSAHPLSTEDRNKSGSLPDNPIRVRAATAGGSARNGNKREPGRPAKPTAAQNRPKARCTSEYWKTRHSRVWPSRHDGISESARL